MAFIRNDPVLNSRIEAMTATLEIFAMLQFEHNGTPYTRPVRIIGIEPIGRGQVGGFQEHLVKESNRLDPSKVFELDEEGQHASGSTSRRRGNRCRRCRWRRTT